MKSGIKSFIEPSFLVCAIILAAAGISKSVVIQKLGIQLIKLPIPLKKPLELLDETELEGYKVVNKVKIDNKDVLESLGTVFVGTPGTAVGCPVCCCGMRLPGGCGRG